MPGFGFGFPGAPQIDPAILAAIKAQMPGAFADPGEAQTQAAQPQAAAPAAPSASPAFEPYKPSAWDVLQGVLFEGKSPAASAMEARARAYQTAQQGMMMQALQQADPRTRIALLTNAGKYGEEYSKNFAPINAGEGSTETMFGGPSAGGSQFFAPKTGIDEKSGLPFAITQQGFRGLGSSLGGDFSVSPSGAIVSGRTGAVPGRVGVPQIVPKGSDLQDYQPTIPDAAQSPSAAPAAPTGGAGARLDPMAFFRSFVLPHEGGLNPADMNGSPTNMGINQAANPGVNVATLKPEQAAQIFTRKYFAQSGAANLPAPLAAVHADTYFINPKMAQSFLAQSGGDPQAYLGLRDAWMSKLAQTNPAAAPYAKAWAQRNADLGQYVASLQGQQPASAASGGTIPSQATTVAQGNTTAILPPGDPAYRGVAPGTKLQRSPTGEITTYAKPNETDQKTVQSYMDTAKTLEDLASMGDQFHRINSGTATGGLYDSHDVEVPLVHTEIPLNPLAPAMRGTHTDVRAMENLSNQLALAQRTPGMRITQMEFQKFLGSAPSINNPGPQNDKIIQGYHALATQRRAYASFMNDWLSQHGSLQGADAAWQHAQAAPKAPPIRTYNPQTGAIE